MDPLAMLGDQQQQDASLAQLLSSSAQTQQPPEVAEPADDNAWTADDLLGRDPSVDPLLELDLTGDTFALGIESHNFAEKGTISPDLIKPWGLAVDMPEGSNMYSHGTWTMQEIMKSPTATTQKDLAALTSTATTTATAAPGKSGSLGRPLLMNPLFRSCTMNSILLGQVTSYPKMMIEGDQLPPSSMHRATSTTTWPLAAERGAVISACPKNWPFRTKANTDFVWTLIYEEQARLQREYFKFTSTQQLAATQSALILLLLQASDPSTVEAHSSEDLLNTVVCFVEHMARTNEWATDARDAVSNRRDWVFRESIRRVLVVLHIVARLLDGFVRGGCAHAPGSSFKTIPLPSSRSLWEARTSRAWMRDYKKNVAARTTDKVLTVGDVLESGGVSRSRSGKGPTTPELLPEVMRRAGGLDTLGMLVWMVMPFEDAREVHEHEAVVCWS
uniref:Uncharacterized protein n=1 Tax=Bionectria ochroleuca TaxID=29856 RepID=A0A8H7NGW7_BIOOC